MAVLQYRTLSNRTVAALRVERDMVFWDRELTGFGVRVQPSGPQSECRTRTITVEARRCRVPANCVLFSSVKIAAIPV